MEVVELKAAKEEGLIVLVEGTIKVVLLFAGHIACRTGSFLCGLKKSVPLLALFGPLPVDFNGRVRQYPSVVASYFEGGMVGV